jgi:Holliday junction resolvasome RuvABC endonuclease subunit
MNILGIDLSLTGTGLAILTDYDAFPEPELPRAYPRAERCMTEFQPVRWYFGYLLSPMPKDTFGRWKAIVDAVLMCAETANVIVMEGYSFGSMPGQSRIHELGGIVRYHLAREQHNWLEVPPSTLKKFLTGKGNADKNVVLKEVYRRYGLDLNDDNMADAFGLAKIGEAMISTAGLPVFQVEVIEGIKTPRVRETKRNSGVARVRA